MNLLTEDNLPAYAIALHHHFGRQSPWAEWVRRWTAEEMRHATVIRDYLTVTRAVDLEALEDARLRHVATNPGPAAPNVLEALVYVALQELAPRGSPTGTPAGRSPTPPGRPSCAGSRPTRRSTTCSIGTWSTAALERHPDATVLAIAAQARHFAMPGIGMAELHEHAPAIADAGIYSMAILQRQVLTPVLLGHWRLDRLDGLSPDAETARRRTLRFLERFGRYVDRLPTAATAAR